jgi:hypothetical protein
MGLFNIDVFLQPLTRLVKKSKPSE